MLCDAEPTCTTACLEAASRAPSCNSYAEHPFRKHSLEERRVRAIACAAAPELAQVAVVGRQARAALRGDAHVVGGGLLGAPAHDVPVVGRRQARAIARPLRRRRACGTHMCNELGGPSSHSSIVPCGKDVHDAAWPVAVTRRAVAGHMKPSTTWCARAQCDLPTYRPSHLARTAAHAYRERCWCGLAIACRDAKPALLEDPCSHLACRARRAAGARGGAQRARHPRCPPPAGCSRATGPG